MGFFNWLFGDNKNQDLGERVDYSRKDTKTTHEYSNGGQFRGQATPAPDIAARMNDAVARERERSRKYYNSLKSGRWTGQGLGALGSDHDEAPARNAGRVDHEGLARDFVNAKRQQGMSDKQILTAAAKVFHPDRNPHPDAKRTFQDVNSILKGW